MKGGGVMAFKNKKVRPICKFIGSDNGKKRNYFTGCKTFTVSIILCIALEKQRLRDIY